VPTTPRIELPGARPQGRLALAVLVSAVAHLLWLGLLQPPSIPRPDDVTPLRLTLVPPRTRIALPGAATAPASGVASPARRPARTAPARPSQPPHDAAPALPAAAPDVPAAPQPEPAPAAPPDAPRRARADMIAAATRDAAVIARELNHASGAPERFRSRAQEELDRRFDAAHAAGGSWFRSARVEEITTAADGNARVYRIVTPVGSFCRTYPANGGQPMNTTCPR
jgi:hypothetical protein